MPKLKLLREAYKPKESEIRKEIMDYLWYIKKIDSRLTHAGQIIPVNDGIPDIMGMFPGNGRTLGIEVKRPGEAPTKSKSSGWRGSGDPTASPLLPIRLRT